MTNLQLNNEIKQLSGYIYHNDSIQKPQGWKLIDKAEGKLNGFYAEAFYKDY